MINLLQLRLADAKKTHLCGYSLASSLYTQPLDIYLNGPVGAGKTTFIQGLAKGLNIQGPVLSPTYALEQRYSTGIRGEFLHLDLYRLKPGKEAEILAASDDHTGIRCIEWANKMTEVQDSRARITIDLQEDGDGRLCVIGFDDISLPARKEIEQWRTDVQLPTHIAAHCDAVAAFASRLGEVLTGQGIVVRLDALKTAGELHDLFRFIDFRVGGGPAADTYGSEVVAVWQKWKKHYDGLKHEPACAAFLRERGFDALATIIEVHGLSLPSPERTTIEQQLLFYADKRVMIDKVVTVEERFEDFHKRYGSGLASDQSRIWRDEALRVEQLLFPEGVPL